MKDIIIVVPAYQKKLNDLERISLQQLCSILSNYDKCFIVPESLKFDYGDESKFFFTECFDDQYFKSTVAYSKLLLSAKFYQRFSEYRYMLIYQMDAFVFSDRIREFCKLSYDYYGAPWNHNSPMYKISRSYVGNGGFSLRHIQNTINILEKNKYFLETKAFPNLKFYGEDVFLACLGRKNQNDYRVCPPEIAVKFSLQCNYRKIYDKKNWEIPFGCHRWYLSDFYIWKPIIESYGYEIDSNNEYISWNRDKDNKRNRVYRYLIKRRLLNARNVPIIRKEIIRHLGNGPYSIWGAGSVGKRCMEVFSFFDIPIHAVYDKKGDNNKSTLFDKNIQKPYIELLKKETCILVTSVVYMQSIRKELELYGLKKDIDFFDYLDIEEIIIKKLYKENTKISI